jgi:hypothetical protein
MKDAKRYGQDPAEEITTSATNYVNILRFKWRMGIVGSRLETAWRYRSNRALFLYFLRFAWRDLWDDFGMRAGK